MIKEGYKANFNTLEKAFKNKEVCLIETTEKATGDTAILVCAWYEEEEEIVLVPLARMIDGNPYDLYESPAT